MTPKNVNLSRRNRMEEIARQYFFAKNMASLSIHKSNKKVTKSNIVQRVQLAYSSLDTLDKEFISNEYFGECYKFWWVNKYPTTTYYRYLNRAVTRFLFAYAKIH